MPSRKRLCSALHLKSARMGPTTVGAWRVDPHNFPGGSFPKNSGPLVETAPNIGSADSKGT